MERNGNKIEKLRKEKNNIRGRKPEKEKRWKNAISGKKKEEHKNRRKRKKEFKF